MLSYGNEQVADEIGPRQAAEIAPAWILLSLGILDLGLSWLAGYAYTEFSSALAIIAIMAGISYGYGHSGRSRAIADMGYYAAMWIAFTVLGVIFTYLMATSRLPLFDDQFARFDAAIGFDWLRWYDFLASVPYVNTLLSMAYSSLLLQIVLSVMYFSHIGQSRRNAELLWNAFISLLLTGVLSAIFPALGAFHHFQTDLPQAVHLPHLLALRDGSMSVFPLKQMQGIIAFPSFHTVMAILFTYAFRGRGVWFLVIGLLNILMMLSTPTFGGHYLADMVAGAVIAGLAIQLVRR
jgi:membrane-associated phospholipid phosphatase